MRRAHCFILGLSIVFHVIVSDGQPVRTDTLKVMTYNTLNYGFPPTMGCPALASWNKHEYLRAIVQYADPDILGLVKMDANPPSFSVDTVLFKVLDSVCAGCYSHAVYTNNSGYTKENMLFFKNAKLGFISTTTIYSGDPNISDINLHTLYFKSPALSATHDTVFIHVILAHLRSGSGNDNDRATEISGAMTWLNVHVALPGNYIFMGDFNTQSSNEACFQMLINSPNINTRFADPENQLGDWSNTPAAFSNYLTQSTRINDPGDCGATGGINDRFDHILCSQAIMSGTDSVNYIPGSFHVLGQDGNHAGLAITDPPVNSSVPPQVLNALYYMSNHLPVTLQLAVHSLVMGETSYTFPSLHVDYSHMVTNELTITANGFKNIFNEKITACLYNLNGELLCREILNLNQATTLSTSNFSSGVYVMRITCGNFLFTGKYIKIPE